MKKILLVLFLLFPILTIAQSDTTALKTLIGANLPDNSSGYITPARLRAVTEELMRSDANLAERNVFAETIVSMDTMKSEQGFFKWNGSGYTEIGSFSPVWARSGGYILPVDYGDTLSIRKMRIESEIVPNGNVNLGSSAAPFDTLYVDLINKINIDTATVGVLGVGTTLQFIDDGLDDAGDVLTSLNDGLATWAKVDPGTGWVSYADDSYTSGSPFVITAGDTTKIPFFWTSTVSPQLPTGVDSLFNRADTTLIGFNGDAYTVRIEFTAQSSNVSGYGSLIFDIGNGTPIIISNKIFTFPKGAAVDHRFSFTVSLFAGATFESRGCQVKVLAGVGNISMHDFDFLITRTHKAQ